MQGINDQLKTWMVSQNITLPFGYINIVTVFINIVLGYLLIMKGGYVEYGFPICKFANECLMFILCVYLWIYKIDAKCKTSPNFGEYKKHIFNHLWMAFKVTISMYSEFLGFE